MKSRISLKINLIREDFMHLNKYAETGGDDTDGGEHHEVRGAADQPLEVGVGGGGLAELDPEERPEQADGNDMKREDEIHGGQPVPNSGEHLKMTVQCSESNTQ